MECVSVLGHLLDLGELEVSFLLGHEVVNGLGIFWSDIKNLCKVLLLLDVSSAQRIRDAVARTIMIGYLTCEIIFAVF